MTYKLRVYITFDTFKGIVLFNPNTPVCLLYKTATCFGYVIATIKLSARVK